MLKINVFLTSVYTDFHQPPHYTLSTKKSATLHQLDAWWRNRAHFSNARNTRAMLILMSLWCQNQAKHIETFQMRCNMSLFLAFWKILLWRIYQWRHNQEKIPSLDVVIDVLFKFYSESCFQHVWRKIGSFARISVLCLILVSPNSTNEPGPNCRFADTRTGDCAWWDGQHRRWTSSCCTLKQSVMQGTFCFSPKIVWTKLLLPCKSSALVHL